MAKYSDLLWSILVVSCAMPGAAFAQQGVVLDFPAQPLSEALRALGKRTDMNILIDPKLVKNVQAPAIKGTLTADQALKQLLVGTALSHQFVDEHTVVLKAVNVGEEVPAGITTSGLAPAANLHLVQSENPGSMQKVVSNPPPPSAAQYSADSSKSSKGIPEILVKGQRSLNTDIRRTEDDVQPYVVFDAATIERSMATNLEDFLKSRLSMNMVQSTNAQQAELPGNISKIDLRGLGSDETLILVNGRRLPGVSELNRGGNIGQADINGIPLSAVERIEVLPSTASGIYGGGATGGVVNIILKSDFDSIELTAVYENTFDTDAATQRLDATAGFNLGAATNVLLTGSYSQGNALTVGDREFVPRAYDLYLRNTQNDFSSNFTPPLASTTNIRGNLPLELKNPAGGAPIPLGSNITSVPIGYAGIASDGGAGLVARAGSYNIMLPTDIQGLGGSILNHPTVSSFGANFRHGFGAAVEAFLDLSWARNEGHTLDAAQTGSITLPAGEGNPFTDTVRVVFPLPGLAFDRVFSSENRIANAGLIVRLPHEWIGQVEYGWSRSLSKSAATSPILSTAARDDIVSGALDIFRDLNVNPVDYAARGYLLDSPNNIGGPFVNTRDGATLRLAGPVWQLPGGPLALSGFYEHRKSAADEALVRTYNSFVMDYRSLLYPSRSRTVDSISMEATAPFFSRRNARTFLHGLDLQASVRYDDYRIDGVDRNPYDPRFPFDPARNTASLDSADYTVGLRYAPSPDIALRASFGTGFLPPDVGQITPTEQQGVVSFIDPKRSPFRETFIIPQTVGGSLGLGPEESESFSAGAILTPRFLDGLRFSIDYTEIRKSDEISNITAQSLLNNEDFFPGRVTREALSDADIAAEYTGGRITYLDISMVNIAKAWVRALDFQLDYTFDMPVGTLRVYALATYLRDHASQVQPTAEVYDNAGHVGQLKWRGNAGLTLEHERWTVDWNMQYFDSYLIYTADFPDQLISSAVQRQGSDTIPSQAYHDVLARFRLGGATGGGMLADMELQMGIKNVFNASPPIIAGSTPSNGYSFFGDPRLRRYTVSLRKSFQ